MASRWQSRFRLSTIPSAMDFPLELEREILETAAELHPQTIPSLLLVSHHVHEWIERIQYSTFISGHEPSVPSLNLLRNAVQSQSRPASFFHDRVHHLYFDILGAQDKEILLVCRGVKSLTIIRIRPFSSPRILPILGAMKLQRLSLSLKELFAGMEFIDLTLPLFSFITHLETFDFSEIISKDFPGFSCSSLALLPALTHLAFDANVGTAFLPVATEIFGSCRKLEVLVGINRYPIHFHDGGMISIDDARFVYMQRRHFEHAADWLAGTRGGLDFWARADAFIAKKRRGEIRPIMVWQCKRTGSGFSSSVWSANKDLEPNLNNLKDQEKTHGRLWGALSRTGASGEMGQRGPTEITCFDRTAPAGVMADSISVSVDQVLTETLKSKSCPRGNHSINSPNRYLASYGGPALSWDPEYFWTVSVTTTASDAADSSHFVMSVPMVPYSDTMISWQPEWDESEQIEQNGYGFPPVLLAASGLFAVAICEILLRLPTRQLLPVPDHLGEKKKEKEDA
ncbi:hypothetical protein DFH07DRAFT_780408 [Mycena maculata]|uniref:Uncharacterized protein n=1 Tax=Mycena maculata TaxID=230809 RepID=A0AAD7MV93_9AGAR|nr:hypothetical protein DFH07DRAFT_780408 [Mycena maculata]